MKLSRRKTKYTILGIIILMLIICFVPIKSEIHLSKDTQIYRINDSTFEENCNIKITGKYSNFLFRTDKFKGEIIIERDDNVIDFGYKEYSFTDGISILHRSENAGRLETVGDILIDPKNNDVLILLFEKIENGQSWSGDDGMYISVASNNREESIKFAKKISKNSLWLSHADWY